MGWIKKAKLDAEHTLHAIGCLANTDFDPEKMDFSYGGPNCAIGEFMEFVTKYMTRLSKKKIDADDVKNLCEKLTAYHKKWDDYGYGDDIKETLDEKIQNGHYDNDLMYQLLYVLFII